MKNLFISFCVFLFSTLNGYSQTYNVSGGIVNVSSWGPDNDITNELDAALEYAYKNKATAIQLPVGNFRRTTTIVFKSSINLLGTGTSQQPATRIGFPANVKCVFIPYRGENGYIMYSGISNMEFYQDAASTYFDTTAHGVHTRSHVRLDNVLISQASGNGFQIEGCQMKGHILEGQTDFSELINCHARYVNTGLFIQGCDANKINVYKFNATACRRWGVYDNGFLGNFYTSPHFAFCGSGTFSDVVCTYNGQHYSAISPDEIINRGFRPDLFPQYWRPCEPMGQGPAWDSTKKYYSGGAYNIVNLNARTTIIDPYMESYQPDAMQAQWTMSINGTRGVSVHGGVDLRSVQGVFASNAPIDITGLNNGLNINSPTLGYIPGIGIKALYGNNPTIMHESGEKARYVFQLYKNSHNDKGTFHYSEDRFQFYPNGVLSFETTPTATYLHKVPVSTTLSNKFLVWDETTKEIKYRADPAVKTNNGEEQTWILQMGDQEKEVTRGSKKLVFRAPFDCIISAVHVSTGTPSTTGAVVFDVNVRGSSILSKKLSIDPGERTSVTAVSPAKLLVHDLKFDDEISVDVENPGSGVRAVTFRIYFQKSVIQ